jgi:hypothetical protein
LYGTEGPVGEGHQAVDPDHHRRVVHATVVTDRRETLALVLTPDASGAGVIPAASGATSSALMEKDQLPENWFWLAEESLYTAVTATVWS